MTSLALLGLWHHAWLPLLALATLLALFIDSRRRGTRPPMLAPLSDVVLVLHASQTGTARGIAHDTGELLRQAGRAVQVRSLGDVRSADALAHRLVLLVLATCGDGDGPDEAQPFVTTLMGWRTSRRIALAGVSFGLLGLGDRRYSDFCGFAREVEWWLRKRGARALFERIEVDGWSPDELQRWEAELVALTGVSAPAAWRETRLSPSRPWRLVDRSVLNPGSAGQPMLHLQFESADGEPLPDWEAGDLARVNVPTLRQGRDYSIASVPADGRLHLVVRQIRRGSGRPGAASGWLAEAELGSEVTIQLVTHPSFRLGDNADRPLVLIGNGAGIAGLRGHLRGRAQRPGARHWLLFGERERAHDALFADEIEAWQAAGTLERVDLAFSRDPPRRAYVQDLLRDAAEPLRAWIADGAAIYICGARSGMAEGVHDALVEGLGEPTLRELAAAGRYRRDVF